MLLTVFERKGAKIAPPQESPLALDLDSNFILQRNLGCWPKFLLPNLSLLPQFLG